MGKEIYIYHHLGLGDHISCHGLVRHYCETYDKVFLFVKEHNYKNVTYMFQDIKNINFLIGDDEFARNFIRSNQIKNVLLVGFTLNTHENFELQFYKMANTPIEYKHEKFFIERDLYKEKQLFEALELESGNYVFLHDGGFKIKNDLIDSKLKIVRPNTHGFFDWMYIIENAKEIHAIDSSFICLIDCMKLNNKIKLYNHRYVRQYPEYIKLYTNKNWNFIY